jgi:hypothetical protein
MQPISPWIPVNAPATERRRGVLLSAFLISSMIGNTILAPALLVMARATARLGPADDGLDPAAVHLAHTTHNATLFLALLAAISVFFLAGAWMWKKWGVYGYGLITGLAMLVGVQSTPTSVTLNLLWCGVIGAVIAAKWRHFE